MKILVTVKRVCDPEQKVKVKDQKVDLSGANYVLNPFDEYAVETALRLTEKGTGGERFGEVVVLSIGPKDASQQLRSCLAMGADRAILIAAEDDQLDSAVVARAITAIYEREKPDLILLGKQTVDGDNNQVPQLVAGYLNLPQACFACAVDVESGGRSLVVAREVDGGTESKRVPLPAVVSVDLRVVLPTAVQNHQGALSYNDGARYASLKGIMQAKKKPIEELELSAVGVANTVIVQTTSVESPPERKAGVKVASVDELVEKLRNEAKAI